MRASNQRKRSPGQAAFDYPPGDSLTALSPRAQTIVKAARALLEEHGYRGISYQKVAAAAGVDKGTISYNFGNKAGLLATVADSLIHDECLAILEEARTLTGEDRIRHAVEGLKRVTLAAEAQRGWFEMLPHAMRENGLRERMQRQYAWWFRMNLEWLGIDLEKMSHNPLVRGLTEVVAAVTDGLAIQVGLGIQSDLSEAMQALEVMVRAVVAQIEAAPLDEA